MKNTILIIDFGSQVTKLIARRIREFEVFSQIIPYHLLNKSILKKSSVKGIIFQVAQTQWMKNMHPRFQIYIYDLGNTNSRYLLWLTINM